MGLCYNESQDRESGQGSPAIRCVPIPQIWRKESLTSVENGVAGAMAKESQGAVIMAGIQTGLNAVGGMETIETGLNSFMQGMPVLMNALDEVAKLQP